MSSTWPQKNAHNWDPANPLAPMELESPRALAALHAYVEAGPRRTIEDVRKRVGFRTGRHIERWSSRFRWRERIAAWIAAEGARLDTLMAETKVRVAGEAADNLLFVAREAAVAFNASKSGTARVTVTKARKGGGDPGALVETGRSEVLEQSYGDPRFLGEIRAATQALCDLLDLYPPKRVATDTRIGVIDENAALRAASIAVVGEALEALGQEAAELLASRLERHFIAGEGRVSVEGGGNSEGGHNRR